MSIQMKMPRLSDTMEQGTIVRWAVKPGQKVRSGDVVADIETDKATMELQTFDDGTVASLAVPEGQQVPVGTVIMVLAEAGEDVGALSSASGAASASASSPTKAAVGAAPASPVASSTGTLTMPASPARGGASPTTNGHHGAAASTSNGSAGTGERVFASPLARKIAAETGVDLSALHGTGPSGRIIRKDVEAAMAGGAAQTGGGSARATSAGPKIGGLSAGAVPGAALQSDAPVLSTRTVALSNMRGTIAKRLVQSKTTIPHYQVTMSVRMDALLALRQQLNEQLASQGVKLSVNDFLVRACALAMHQHPYINSRWIEGGAGGAGKAPAIEFLGQVNIGVAIALPVNEAGEGGGLVVATLRDADRIGLRQISANTKKLSDKARAKGLSLDEMSDSTFTISNLGMFGVEHFTAIINPPNTAILAVGAAVEKPVVAKDTKTGEKKLVIGTEMQMTMSSDHRVIDGAMAAQYLATVKQLLETPATLLV
jgi:pyruvate dehydrogenase E2 component (dihydrolipoamide acetyltransferase)